MDDLKRFPAFLVSVIRDRRSFVVEFYLSGQAICFGWWVILPSDAFARGAELYTALSMIPEVVWGTAFLAHGITHLVSLFAGDRRMRLASTSVSVFLWLMVLVGFLVAAPLSTAIPMYGWSTAAALWAHNAQSHLWRHR